MYSEARFGQGKAITRTPAMRPDFKQWFQRIMWLVAIWFLSIAVLGMAAWGLRVLMRSIGMSPA
ncbi:MAG TPA: DUF2474 domain-containing protein [Burkholderiaceae bacterium]|nr:DUF2474 domain-containing protein [Burkholderiaceae bacterium]